MIDLSKYRIVDLSHELVPGERKIDGEYGPGTPWFGRPIELQEFTFLTARIHFLQAQTHLGTHCEAPYKYHDGPDIAGTELSFYLGPMADAADWEVPKAPADITPGWLSSSQRDGESATGSQSMNRAAAESGAVHR